MILDIHTPNGPEQIQHIRKIEIHQAWNKAYSITAYFYDGGSVTIGLDDTVVKITND